MLVSLFVLSLLAQTAFGQQVDAVTTLVLLLPFLDAQNFTSLARTVRGIPWPRCRSPRRSWRTSSFALHGSDGVHPLTI